MLAICLPFIARTLIIYISVWGLAVKKQQNTIKLPQDAAEQQLATATILSSWVILNYGTRRKSKNCHGGRGQRAGSALIGRWSTRWMLIGRRPRGLGDRVGTSIRLICAEKLQLNLSHIHRKARAACPNKAFTFTTPLNTRMLWLRSVCLRGTAPRTKAGPPPPFHWRLAACSISLLSSSYR